MSADVLGSRIATSAGYDPLGLLLMLTTLDTIDREEPRMSVMFATHPPTADRIDHLAGKIADVADEYDSSLLDSARFGTVQQALFETQ